MRDKVCKSSTFVVMSVELWHVVVMTELFDIVTNECRQRQLVGTETAENKENYIYSYYNLDTKNEWAQRIRYVAAQSCLCVIDTVPNSIGFRQSLFIMIKFFQLWLELVRQGH
jgi:hypothetical protein